MTKEQLALDPIQELEEMRLENLESLAILEEILSNSNFEGETREFLIPLACEKIYEELEEYTNKTEHFSNNLYNQVLESLKKYLDLDTEEDEHIKQLCDYITNFHNHNYLKHINKRIFKNTITNRQSILDKIGKRYLEDLKNSGHKYSKIIIEVYQYDLLSDIEKKELVDRVQDTGEWTLETFRRFLLEDSIMYSNLSVALLRLQEDKSKDQLYEVANIIYKCEEGLKEYIKIEPKTKETNLFLTKIGFYNTFLQHNPEYKEKYYYRVLEFLTKYKYLSNKLVSHVYNKVQEAEDRHQAELPII